MTNNQQQGEVCWYCKKNPADQRYAASIPMYNVTGGDYKDYGVVGVNKISFNRIGVTVPRCESCQKRQGIINKITQWTQGILSLAGVIMLVAAGAIAFNFVRLDGYQQLDRAGILAIVALIVCIIGWNTRTFLNVALSAISPIKPEFYGSTSPNVQKMLAAKWRVGKKPMG